MNISVLLVIIYYIIELHIANICFLGFLTVKKFVNSNEFMLRKRLHLHLHIVIDTSYVSFIFACVCRTLRTNYSGSDGKTDISSMTIKITIFSLCVSASYMLKL